MPENLAEKSRILIVGAGAMGLVAGYHLHLAGAEITFLVRPGRAGAAARPKILYCYDDATLKAFSAFRVISEAADISSSSFAYVIVTLDGFAVREPEGVSLLQTIGRSIRDASTCVIIGGIGVGLHDFYCAATELPEDRVLNGALGLLCHLVEGFPLPAHHPTDPNVLSKAYVAYRHINKYGFTLDHNNREAAERFASLYDASEVSRCHMMPRQEFAMMTKVMFPVFAASELLGWPRAKGLDTNPELWALTVHAVQEVQGLDEHGSIGKGAQASLTGDSLLEMWASLESAMLPLDYAEFMKLHHGFKHRSQDIQLLENCVDIGERQGSQMKALKQLLAQLRATPH
jgi:Ketopantoate reductase PanE/ApbA